jgi:hypothetical protein
VVSSFSTSVWVTWRKLNKFKCSCTGRELIISPNWCSVDGVEPSRRWAVKLKWLFRSSGSALIGWGLGWSIRWIVCHSSFGFLEDNAFW